MIPKSKKITINEIAALAGVSKGTVSKILNNKSEISDATKKRVLAIISSLNYIPNPTAQALANQRTTNIGLIIPSETGTSLTGSYWSSLISIITKSAYFQGYNLMLFAPQNDEPMDTLYDSIIRNRKVDGLLIGAGLVDSSSVKLLIQENLPFVLIGRTNELDYYSVDIENKGATIDATQYLIEKGYKNIAFLSGPLKYRYNQDRTTGFTEACSGKISGYSTAVHSYSTRDIYAAVDRILQEIKELDSLFIGAGSNFLFDVLSRLKYHKITPKNLGIIAFDDYRFLDYFDPQITAIKQPLEEIGSEASAMLFKLLANEKVPVKNIVLPTSIHSRGSCRDSY